MSIKVDITPKPNKSSGNVTDDAVACDKFWAAALTLMNAEKQTAKSLNKENIETFVATKKEKHKWSDRIKVIERLIIPMVVFVHITEEDLPQLRNNKNIRKILSYPGDKIPTRIPDEQIERFKFMLDHSEEPVLLDNRNLTVGENIRVIKGPLYGLCGFLLKSYEGESFISISIDGLGMAKTNIDINCVERIN
jgi:hypothetical protein